MRWWHYLALLAAIFIPLAAALLFQAGTTTAQPHSGIFPAIVLTCYPEGRRPAAADFTLVDQYGRNVTLSALWGRPVLLTFTYTYCPDVCPLMNQVLNRTLPMVRGLFGAVLDVTLDPERDTVKRLYAYAVGNRFNWTFLTGDPGALEAVWRAYGVTRQKVDGNIVHSVTYLVVQGGKILGRVDGGPPAPETLASYLRRVVEGSC